MDLDADFGIRFDAIDRQVAALARAGLDGVYCNGTATEFHGQTEAQFVAVARRTVAAARSAGLPVQVGASHPLAPGALDRIRIAADLAPDAIQVTLPDWTPIDRDAAIRFLEGCAGVARSIPLVLYNPPHARTVLSPADLVAVTDRIDTLIGLKCGGGDAAWYAAMAPVLARLSVFVPGHHYASGVRQGAHGSYSNMACLSPAGAVRWARLTVTDAAEAAALETRVADFMAEAIAPLLKAGFPGFACDKAMAAAAGWTPISTRMLWPYAAVPESAIARIRRAARRHLPDFTAEQAALP